ncbi:flagellar biosynthesis protein FlhF [Orenia marismortui]|uniref:Flagellar biosynthesis protein FlhF n=1 Tax=Orenia marismortui TaxID=46469 RepID=A0A4R8GZD1_9FIRM|nr:flagellar biosynthesis protein FlhF [Orenia marismortui]TDX51913.1 flagellar biosynthesis protein FlhF [Orenia marismortui]
MKIKKYQAENMQEAILKVKSDLGSDAIILHSRKFKKGGFFGFFAKKMVEVVATVEAKSNKTTKKNKKVEKLNETNTYLKEELNQMKKMMNNLLGEVKFSNKKHFNSSISPQLEQLVEGLSKLGFSHKTAINLANKVAKDVDINNLEEEKLKESLREEFKTLIDSIVPIKLEEAKTKVVALVGPTGVGKTTTLAKLAANFSLFENKKVGLVTADTYRIAAVDQLKTYSEILNLPLEVVFTPQELVAAIEGYADYDLVLVDTAGRSQNNQIHISELKGFIKNAPIDEICLVLSATTKLTDLIKIIDIYNEVDLDKLIITKVDETNSLATLLEATSKVKKPLSYITIGQDVPEDIKLAEIEELVDDIVEELEL